MSLCAYWTSCRVYRRAEPPRPTQILDVQTEAGSGVLWPIGACANSPAHPAFRCFQMSRETYTRSCHDKSFKVQHLQEVLSWDGDKVRTPSKSCHTICALRHEARLTLRAQQVVTLHTCTFRRTSSFQACYAAPTTLHTAQQQNLVPQATIPYVPARQDGLNPDIPDADPQGLQFITDWRNKLSLVENWPQEFHCTRQPSTEPPLVMIAFSTISWIWYLLTRLDVLTRPNLRRHSYVPWARGSNKA